MQSRDARTAPIERRRAGWILIALAGAIVMGLPLAARAACTVGNVAASCESMDFSAQILNASDPAMLLGQNLAGTIVQGTLTIDTAVADTDGQSDSGFYPFAIECIEIDFGQNVMTINQDFGSASDFGLEVVNDLPFNAMGVMTFTDTVDGRVGGLGDIDGLAGAGGVVYGYSATCFPPLVSCPPTVVTDDSIPNAPGDLTALMLGASTMALDFQTIPAATSATATATILDITNTTTLPCLQNVPEPATGGSAAALLSLIWLARRRNRAV